MSNFSYQNMYNDGTGLFVSSGTSSVSTGVPIATILMYPSVAVPTGWLRCDGSEYSKGGIYATLFSTIGSVFNNPTTPVGKFAVPDFRGRFPIGYDTGGYSGAFSNSQPSRGAIAQGKKILADQLPVIDISNGSLAISDTTAVNQTTIAVNQTTIAVNQTTIATNQTTIATNQTTIATNQSTTATNQTFVAVNQDADVEVGNHQHFYGHLHENSHTHDEGTLVYTQNSHNHATAAHHHDLLRQSGSSSNYAFPFKWNNIGSATYKGFWWGYGDEASAQGASACYEPQSMLPIDNSATTNSGLTLASGTIAGDTGGQDGTSGSVANHTSRSKNLTAPYPTDNYTDNPDFKSTTSHTHVQDTHNHTQDAHNHTQDTHNHTQDAHNHIQDTHNHIQDTHNHIQDSHGHLQDPHGHTLSGTIGTNTTPHDDYQPPLLSIDFIIKYLAS